MVVWGVRFLRGATHFRESLEGGVGRGRRVEDSEGSGRVVMHGGHFQCRARVGGGGFEEATKLFGSGEKHVDMNESVSSSSYLGLASMSRWNQMIGTKREREERGEENTLEMLAQVLKKKKKSQQHNSHQLGQQLVWL